jgi:murein DD-endopeptidase MepM/ murein hydrolase activator NlpD
MQMDLSRRAVLAALVSLPLARPGTARAAADPFGLTGPARQGAALLGSVPDETMALWLDETRVDFDADGRFIIAFDRDAPPEARLRADLRDDRHVELLLAVAAGDWQIETVDAPLLGNAQTSADYEQRRAAELEQIAAARAIQSGSSGWRQTFVWPVKARISGRFGAQRIYQGTPGSYHSGLDLAGRAGTPYVAPADGVVILAASAPFTLEGNLLMIDHGMGLNSAFLHSSKLLVGAGETVRQGQPLGQVGATGRASGPHLHWGMKWGNARIDPLRMLEG